MSRTHRPIGDRFEELDRRPRSSGASGPDRPADQPQPLQSHQPTPQRRGGHRGPSPLAGEAGLPRSDRPERRGASAPGALERFQEMGLEGERLGAGGGDEGGPFARLLGAQQGPAQPRHRAARAAREGRGGPDELLEQRLRCGPPEGPRETVAKDLPQLGGAVRSEGGERLGGNPRGLRPVPDRLRIGVARQHQPHPGGAVDPLGEESMREPERPNDRGGVGRRAAQVVQHDHRGTPVAVEPPKEAGENLVGREPFGFEPLVQALNEGARDALDAATPAEANRDHDRRSPGGPGPSQVIPPPPRNEPGDGRGPAPRWPADGRDGRLARSRARAGEEPRDGLGAERKRRRDVVRCQNLRVGDVQHGLRDYHEL